VVRIEHVLIHCPSAFFHPQAGEREQLALVHFKAVGLLKGSVSLPLIKCIGYRLSRRKQIIEEYFEADDWAEDWSPRFNIAPTQAVPVIRQHPKEPVRQISTMRWGLIPHWAKDASGAASTINARAETAAEKPAFRDPFRYRRCLIPERPHMAEIMTWDH
jgi:SOS response associated peptidase (SRAP)